MKPTEQQSIGREAAIALAQSNWWEGKSPREIAGFQLFTKELSMPFGVFHEALEKSLGRPVFTHELGLNYEGIVKEFQGLGSPPSFEEILALIPPEKLLVVVPLEAEPTP
jgi:hypothetical protein